MAGKRNKELKVALTPDQFSITEKGELVINDADVARTVQEAMPAAGAEQAAQSEITVVVSVGISF